MSKQKSADEPVSFNGVDPEAAIRALLKVDPKSKAKDDEDQEPEK